MDKKWAKTAAETIPLKARLVVHYDSNFLTENFDKI